MGGGRRICFVKPVGPRTLVGFPGPDLGFGYLATAARRAGWSASWIDAQASGLSQRQLVRKLEADLPDMIGFKVYTKDLLSVRDTTARLKRRCPSTVLLAGGPHISAVGLEAHRHLPDVDFFIQGEGEIPLHRLLSAWPTSGGDRHTLADIPGLIFRSQSGWQANPPHREENLDALGLPDWDLLRPDTYPRYSLRVRGPYVPIQTARGCPYMCTYCAVSAINGRHVRVRSVRHVVEELRWLRDSFGISHFSIIDDGLLSHREHLDNLLDAFIEQVPGMVWECSSNGLRVDLLDVPLIRKLERSGCYYIGVGVESGSDRTLARMRKGVTTRELEAGIRRVRSHSNLKIRGYFILGYPGETREEVFETIRFALRLPLDAANFFLFSPQPGTEIYNQLLREGRLRDTNVMDSRQHLYEYPALALRDMSRRELAWATRMAYLRFHARPRTALGLLHRDTLREDLRLGTGLLMGTFFPRRKFFHVLREEPSSHTLPPEGGGPTFSRGGREEPSSHTLPPGGGGPILSRAESVVLGVERASSLHEDLISTPSTGGGRGE